MQPPEGKVFNIFGTETSAVDGETLAYGIAENRDEEGEQGKYSEQSPTPGQDHACGKEEFEQGNYDGHGQQKRVGKQFVGIDGGCELEGVSQFW